MSLVRWSRPLLQTPFEDEFTSMFRGFLPVVENAVEPHGFMPALDVHETKDAYTVTAELPGLSQADVKVSVVDNTLVIRGEKKVEREVKDARFHRTERSFGRFERMLKLTNKVNGEQVSATLKDGVLTVSVPKADEVREHQIEIRLN